MTEENMYLKLLKRAKSRLPEKIATHERFRIPAPELIVEGRYSVVKNFMQIVETIRRDPNDVLSYLLRELGTAGTLDGQRVVFKSKVNSAQVEERIQNYVDTYVICTECKRPDTHIIKEGRVQLLECEACGARRPLVLMRKAVPELKPEMGKIYELVIQDIGKKGDGVARLGDYVIYIPGTTKGSTVKAKIERIMDKICFATVAME